MPLKIDLHVHTVYSVDSFITVKDLVFFSEKRGLDGVAITDHDTVSGFKKFSKVVDLFLIPGVEISTSQGHVLGIGVDGVIEGGLSFAETVDLVHEAGGLAIVAHPTAFFKGIPEERLDGGFDAMEVVNASAVPFHYSVRKNRRLAVGLGLPQTGGSDAHYGPEVGMGYSLVDADAAGGVDEVVEAIRKGAVKPCGKGIPWSMRVKREFLDIRRWLRRF